MNTFSKKEACRMLCRYHNLDGAEALSGKSGVETIMRRIHSIRYDPLNVVARNADLVLQARVRDYAESDLLPFYTGSVDWWTDSIKKCVSTIRLIFPASDMSEVKA